MNYHHLRSLQDRLVEQGGRHLGTVLWWSLNDNRIAHHELAALADQHCLPERYLPSPVKPIGAFRRAWRQASAHIEEGLLLRLITEDENVVLVGVVNERPDTQARDLDYDLKARIAFDKASANLTCDVDHPVFHQVARLFEHHQALTTRDIRAMITAFTNESAVPLRQRGGTYFIPSSQQAVLDALAAVVEQVGDNLIYQLPIYDAPAVQETLSSVARMTLDAEIRSLLNELDQFDDKTRASTIERRLDHFEALQQRVSLFSGALSFKAGDLHQRLVGIQSRLRTQLGLPPIEIPAAEIEDVEGPTAMPAWQPDAVVGF